MIVKKIILLYPSYANNTELKEALTASRKDISLKTAGE